MPRKADFDTWKHFEVKEELGKKTATCKACNHFYANANVSHLRDHLKTCSKHQALLEAEESDIEEIEENASALVEKNHADPNNNAQRIKSKSKSQTSLLGFCDKMSSGK